MTMDLETALAYLNEVLSSGVVPSRTGVLDTLTAEALGVVLTAARERFAARVVEETNRLTARALEVNRPHEYRPGRSPHPDHCAACGRLKVDPLHDLAPKSTATPR